MEGFEAGEPYETMGLRGNNLCPLYFKDVRVPPENVLGEPGEGFHFAMQILNNGRMSLGTGSVGLAKRLLDLTIDHVTTRRQFDQPIGDFDMVEDKIGWMVSYLFGLESMSYMTTGLVDAGVEDYSVESAMAKVAGTEFVWYLANRALQLKGGEGYMRDQPFEQILRDIRIFPIFEGANDVLRSYVALSAPEAAGRGAAAAGRHRPARPDRLARQRRRLRVRPRQARGRARRPITKAHEALADSPSPSPTRSSACATRPRSCCASTARRSSSRACPTGASPTRSATSTPRSRCSRARRRSSRSRASRPRGQEQFIAETFCRARRAAAWTRARPARAQRRRPMHSIARLAYKRGEYGYALFDD